ncbi:hypothetical protein FPV67DRAFT_1460890 [Lyophyllum atratum]|nr:hypothetical protein FPV67DRAFT_1460890 [Lyophyllum atratum]
MNARTAENDAATGSDNDSVDTCTNGSVSDAVGEYPVVAILGHKWSPETQRYLYLVHWDGFTLEESTWEPFSSFEDDREKINEYCRRGGPIQPFDWVQWDNDRAAEQEARLMWRAKRALRRLKRIVPRGVKCRRSEDDNPEYTANTIDPALLTLTASQRRRIELSIPEFWYEENTESVAETPSPTPITPPHAQLKHQFSSKRSASCEPGCFEFRENPKHEARKNAWRNRRYSSV